MKNYIILLFGFLFPSQKLLATEEATMINTKYFGQIDIDWESEVEIRSDIDINNRKSSCLLMIDPDVKVTKELSTLLDSLPELDSAARKAFDAYNKDDLIDNFIEHHIDILKLENDILNSFGITGELNRSDFLKALIISQVNVRVSGINEFQLFVDYMLDDEISNDILVVTFSVTGNVLEIIHES